MATVTIMRDGAKPYVYEIPGTIKTLIKSAEKLVDEFPSDITVIVDEWPPTIITTRNT